MRSRGDIAGIVGSISCIAKPAFVSRASVGIHFVHAGILLLPADGVVDP